VVSVVLGLMAAACSGKVNPIPQAANNLCVQLSMETGTFSLVDDPKVSLKELISKGGYGFVDPAITDQNFKLSIEGKRDVVVWSRNSCGTFIVFKQAAEAGFAPDRTTTLRRFIGNLWKQQQVAFPLVISFAVIMVAVLCQHAP
jgi:hypothetical protein